ncbi:MAG: hypothetical protein AAF586_07325 [Planctomycetota bacterium]
MSRLPGMMDTNDGATDDESSKSMSLMSGVTGGDDALDGVIVDEPDTPGRSPWVQTAILLVIVACLGAGALYFMRSSQDDIETHASGDLTSRIDEALGKLTNAELMSADDPYSPDSVNRLFSNTDRVLAIFAADPAEKQVPVEYIKKNPFSIRVQRIVEETGEPQEQIDIAAQQRLAKLEQSFRSLQLQSVVDMRVPVAVINGEMYRRGDTIDMFYVSAISSKHQAVKLEAENRDWVLRMQIDQR